MLCWDSAESGVTVALYGWIEKSNVKAAVCITAAFFDLGIHRELVWINSKNRVILSEHEPL